MSGEFRDIRESLVDSINEQERAQFVSQFNYPFFQLAGSVIPRIWLPVLLLTLWSTVITCLYQLTFIKLNTDNIFLTLLNFTLGMILVFRTNGAYDRYWEGRRLWGQLYTCVRNLSRYIWIHMKEQTPQDVAEKKAGIHVLLGFIVATKHYLREEYSYDHVKRYIGHIPRRPTPRVFTDEDPEGLDSQLLSIDEEFRKTNYPLEIIAHLSSFLNYAKTKELDPSIYGSAQGVLATMVDLLSSFERISRTPLPLAYTLHLSHLIWIDLVFLPFQLIKYYGWITILVTLLFAFCLLGIEAIGREIENPFGLDYNDLQIDGFEKEIKEELRYLTNGPFPKVTDWKIELDQQVI